MSELMWIRSHVERLLQDEWAQCRVQPDADGDIPFYRELNDIQQRCTSAAVLWAHGRVYVSQTISPIGLTRPLLAPALNAVGGVADDIGLLLAGMFNGSTPYPAETTVAEDEGAA